MPFAVPDADPRAIEALMTVAGSDEQKSALPAELVSGEWTGTMNSD